MSRKHPQSNSTWARWLRSWFSEGRSRTFDRRRKRLRLELEQLEGRLAPATYIWSGGGLSNTNWSNPRNWQGGVAPKGALDDLVFPGGVTSLHANNDLIGGTLNSITLSGSNYSLTGNAVTLGSPLVSGSGFINVATASTGENISLNIQMGGAAGSRQFITVGATALLTYAGQLSGGSGVELTKAGTGTLILSTSNKTFSGPVDITAGIVEISNAFALGSGASPTTVETNAQLRVANVLPPPPQAQNNVAAGLTINEPLILNGPGIASDGALFNVVGNNTWTGNIQLDSDTYVGGTYDTLTINGTISDLGAGHAITKVGVDRVILGGSNTYRGATTVTQGVLGISNPSGLGNVKSTPPTVVNSGLTTAGTLELLQGAGIIQPYSLTLNGQGANYAVQVVGVSSPWTAPFTGFYLPPPYFPVIGGTFTLSFDGASTPASGPTALQYGASAATVQAALNALPTIKQSGGSVVVSMSSQPYPQDPSTLPFALGITDLYQVTFIGPLLGYAPLLVGAGNFTPNPDPFLPPLSDTSVAITGVGDGALQNFTGNNSWTGTVQLGSANSPIPAGSSIYIGADIAPQDGITNLLISGQINDPPPGTGPYNVAKVGLGELILTNGKNSYLGSSTVADGILNVEDSQALGPLSKPKSTITVQVGSWYDTNPALNNSAELDVQLQKDNIDGLIPKPVADSVTGTFNQMSFAYPLNLYTTGINGEGALLSVSGMNTWSGKITLSSSEAAIGVNPDPHPSSTTSYLTTDYSLTVTGDIAGKAGTTFAKVGKGQLILPGANDYLGPTLIAEGWITIENDNALGTRDPSKGDGAQPTTTVYPGAALHLLAPSGGGPLTLTNSFILNGTGISAPSTNFALLSQQGALINLDGNNIISGNIQLNGNVGIDVQDVFGPSQLTLTGMISQWAAPDFYITQSGNALENDKIIDTGSTSGTIQLNWNMYQIPDDLRVYDPPYQTGATPLYDSTSVSFTPASPPVVVKYNNPASTSLEIIMDQGGGTAGTAWTYTAHITPNPATATAGIIKFGDMLLNLQGQGTYPGEVDIRAGIVHAQSSTALGAANGGTVMVEAGAALEIDEQPPVAGNAVYGPLTGGISAGIQVADRQLIVNGNGNTSVTGSLVNPVTVLAGDNIWSGNINLTGNLTLDVAPGARLVVLGNISDSADPQPANITKIDTGELALYGNNSYRGQTIVNGGVVVLGSNSALGAAPTSEVQTVTVTGTTGQTFSLGFNNQSTGLLPVGATALQVQGALNKLTTIGQADINGLVSVTQSGNVYTVTFLGNLIGFHQPMLQPNLGGGTAGVSVHEVSAGTGGVVVANGASLELQGNITIAGKPVIISGMGTSSGPITPTWFPQGPTPINGVFGGSSGRIDGVAVDPTDPNTIYIAAAGGGAWKTENGGQTWVPIFDQGPGNPPIYAGAIAISPTNPQVIYLGTGDASNIGAGPFGISYYGSGVYMSSDSGRTWTLLGAPGSSNPLYGAAVSRMVVDPAHPSIVYVATSDVANNFPAVTNEPAPESYPNLGVWRWDGTTWANLTDVVSFDRAFVAGKGGASPPLLPGPDDDYRISFPQSNTTWSDLAFAGGTLYAALGNGGGDPFNAVFRCPNPEAPAVTSLGGIYWDMGDGLVDSESSKEFPNGLTTQTNGNIRITAVPNGGSVTIYAAITDPFFQGLLNVQVSTDGGMTWNATRGQPFDYLFPQGDYDSTIIAVNDGIGNVVYVAGAGSDFPFEVQESQDGGNTWFPIEVDSAGNSPHVDYHAMDLNYGVSSNPDLANLVVGNDGGIWQRNTATGLWKNLNSNLQLTQFLGIAVNPANPNNALGGSQDNGTEVFDGTQPANFQWMATDGGDGGPVTINSTNPNIVYHELNGLLVESTNGGLPYANGTSSWNDILQINFPTNRGLFFPLVEDSIDPSRLLIGMDNTFDSGSGLPIPGYSINPLTFARVASGNLQQSLDGGQTWTTLNLPTYSVAPFPPPPPGGLNQMRVQAIGIAEYQGTFQPDPSPTTTDAGFPDVLDQGANTYDPNTVYVSDGTSVMVTKDGGVTWLNRSTGLPSPGGIVDIEVDPRNRDTAYVVENAIPQTDGTDSFTGPKVMMTTNAGQSWSDVSYNLPDFPTWKLVIDPRDGSLYVGNDIGVYQLPGGPSVSTSWVQVGAGLPNVQVRDMVLNQQQNMLTVGTYGRGMWQIYLDGTQTNGGALSSVGNGVWAGPVILAGPTTISAFGSQALQNGVTNASLNIVGSISDQTLGASGNTLTKIGGGDVILSGANTYAGATDIQQGVLIANNTQALGSSNLGATVEDGTALELESNLNSVPITLNGDGFSFDGHNTGALRNISNNNTYTGNITLNSNATIGVDSGTRLTITGTINDKGNGYTLTKELTGTLALMGADSYGLGSATTSSTFVNQGALDVENPGALGINNNLTVVLDGAQLQLQGNFTVTNQNLDLSGSGIFGTGALETVDNASVPSINAWDGPITLDENAGFSPATTPPDHVAFGVASAGDILTILTTISDAVSLDVGLDKVGAGQLILQTEDTYTGSTDVIGGRLEIEDSQALGLAGSSTVVNVENGAALQLQANPLGFDSLTGNSDLYVIDTLNLNGSGPSGAGALENVGGFNGWSGPIFLQTDSAIGVDPVGSLAIDNIDLGNFDGGLQDPLPLAGTPANFTKTGTGTLYFASPNTYSGNTIVAQGVLDIQDPNALGGHNATTTVQAGATLALDGGFTVSTESLVLAGAGFGGIGALENFFGTNAWTSPITLAANAAMGVVNSFDELILQTPISDGGNAFGVTEVGQGTIDYQAANTYTGLTLVISGALLLDNATGQSLNGNLTVSSPSGGGLGGLAEWTSFSNQVPATSTVTVNNNASLDLNGQAQTVKNLVIVDGSATTTGGAGGGTLTVTNSLSMTGGSLLLNKAADQLILDGSVTATSDATTGSAVISGPGTVVLGGSIPFTISHGAYTVQLRNSGTLISNLSGLIGTAPSLSITSSAGGTVQTLNFGGTILGGTFTLTLNGVTTGSISWSTSPVTLAANIQSALNAIASPQAAAGVNNTFTITFPFNGSQSTLFGIGSSSLGGPTAVIATVNGTAATQAVQTISFTGGTPTTGSFTLTYGGATPVAIFWSNPNAMVQELQTAINQLAGIGVTSISSYSGPSSDLDIASPVGGSGSLVKNGVGRLELDAIDPYTGSTQVNAGELEVDGSITKSAISVAGGSVSGNGSVDGLTVTKGFVDPGDNGASAPFGPGGVLSSNQDVNFSANSDFFVDLNNAAAGPGKAGYDQLSVTGNVNLNGATLTGAVGSNVNIGDQFTILTATGNITGRFAEPFTPNTVYFGVAKFNVIYNTSTSPETVVLVRQKNTATMTVTSSLNPTVYGQDVVFTATVSAEAGAGHIPSGDSVTFTVTGGNLAALGLPFITGNVPLTATGNLDQAVFDPQRFANVTLPPSPPGQPYVVAATYNGDAFFNSFSLAPAAQPQQVVNQGKTNISLIGTPSSPVYGQGLTVTAQVTAFVPPVTPAGALPSGNGSTTGVVFTIDGQPYNSGTPVTISASGQATIVLNNLTANLHLIDATYTGDNNYVTSSTIQHLSVTVQKATATVGLTASASPTPPMLGEPVTLTATISAPGTGVPTGTLSFFDGSTFLGSAAVGTPTLVVSSLAVGTHTLTATYSGDLNFNGATGQLANYTVTAGSTSASITPSSPTAVFGQTVTFTAGISVTDPYITGTPSGSVQFSVDGGPAQAVALSSAGTAVLSVSSLIAGPHTINVTYPGASNLAPATASLNYTVNPASTTTTLSSSGSFVFGQAATFTAAVAVISPATGIPTGSVNFSIDSLGVVGSANLSSGQAVFVYNGVLPVGAHTITATFTGSSNFAGSTSSSLNQMVGRSGTRTVVSVSPGTLVSGQPTTLTASISPTAPGAGGPTGTVLFVVDTVTVNFGSPANVTGGLASLVVNLGAGNHTISAVYSGDGNFFGSTATSVTQGVSKDGTTTTISASPSAVFGQPVVFTATVAPNLPGTGTPTGNVSFFVGTSSQPVATVALNGSGQASFSDSALAVGSDSITASYAGDGNYIASNAAAFNETVSKDGTTVALNFTATAGYGQAATFTAVVSPKAPGAGNPGGTVTFVIDGVSGSPVTMSGGQATFATSTLGVGPHTINASYSGDGNFSAGTTNNTSPNFTVTTGATTTVVSSSGPVVYGQPLTLSVKVSATAGTATPTGSVSFAIDGSGIGSATVSGGQASFVYNGSLLTVNNSTLPSHTITANYSGDGNFSGSTGSLQQVVGQAGTNTTVTSAGTAVFGQTVTFTANVSAAAPGAGLPTGTVTFVINGVRQTANPVTLNGSGQATFSTSALTLGPNTIAAIYSGDTNFFGSSDTSTPLSQTVSQSPTTTTVVASPNPAGSAGQPVTLTATVVASGNGSGNPSGTVTFAVDGSTVGTANVQGGQASLTDSALIKGLHQITATYNGDVDFKSSSGSTQETVGQAASNTAVTSAGAINFGQSVTFTASVSAAPPGSGMPTPTGTVTFLVNNVAVSSAIGLGSNGQAIFVDNALGAGNQNITASYSGDNNYGGSTSPVYVQVVNKTGTNLLLSSSGSSVFGQTMSFTATVTAAGGVSATPSGTVTFVVDGVTGNPITLSGGVASFTTNSLVVGLNTISASYSGDSNFAGNSSTTPLSINVSQAASKTVLTVPGTSVYGQSIILTATVTGVPAGAGVPSGDGVTTGVTFVIDGSSQPRVAMSGGQATLAISSLGVGSHNIVALYSGDSNFAASGTGSTPLLQKVNLAGTTTTVTSSGTATYGQTVTLTATIAAVPPGAGTPTGSVTFTVDGVTLASGVSLVNGQATVTDAGLTAGTHTVTASYGGDSNFQTSSNTSKPFSQTITQGNSTTTLTASANPIGFGQAVTFVATVAPVPPAGGVPSGTVTFSVDGVNQSPVSLNASGQASFVTSSLAINATHAIVATYNADNNFLGSVSATLNENVLNPSATTISSSASTSVYGQGVTFTATVGASGSASGTPTGSVTFVINGVPQTPVALASGQATFSSSTLSPGTYTVSAGYSGDASFAGSTGSLTQTVNRDGTTTTLSAIPPSGVYGQLVTLTATVASTPPGAGAPSGNVVFSIDGGNLAPAAIGAGGHASAVTGPLSAGTHTIIATYTDDTNFAGSASASASYSVTQAPTSTNVTSSGATVFGQTVTITATVSTGASGAGTPSGSVQFVVDGSSQGVPVSVNGSGQATLTLSTLAAGGHTINASFQGSTNFGASSGSLSYSVGQDGTSVAITSSGTPSAFGQSVTFTANVSNTSTSATPTGTVQFAIDGTNQGSPLTLASGHASFAVSNLVVGPHTISATYSGSTNFAGSSNTFSHTVNQATTTTTLTGTPSTAAPAQAITFSAVVAAQAPGAGTPTGTVTFLITGGSSPVSHTANVISGKATFAISTLAIGSYTVTATYNGSTSFAGSVSTAINERVAKPTTTTLTSSLNPSTFGTAVTFTATLSTTLATGTVTFMDGTTVLGTATVSAGKAKFTISTLSVATHTIKAVYSGDSTYGSSTGTLSQTVVKSIGRNQ